MKHTHPPSKRPTRPLPEIIMERLFEIDQNQMDLANAIRRIKGWPPKPGYSGLINMVLQSHRGIPKGDEAIWAKALRWHGDEPAVEEFLDAAMYQRANLPAASRPAVANVRAIQEESLRLAEQNARLVAELAKLREAKP